MPSPDNVKNNQKEAPKGASDKELKSQIELLINTVNELKADSKAKDKAIADLKANSTQSTYNDLLTPSATKKEITGKFDFKNEKYAYHLGGEDGVVIRYVFNSEGDVLVLNNPAKTHKKYSGNVGITYVAPNQDTKQLKLSRARTTVFVSLKDLKDFLKVDVMIDLINSGLLKLVEADSVDKIDK